MSDTSEAAEELDQMKQACVALVSEHMRSIVQLATQVGVPQGFAVAGLVSSGIAALRAAGATDEMIAKLVEVGNRTAATVQSERPDDEAILRNLMPQGNA